MSKRASGRRDQSQLGMEVGIEEDRRKFLASCGRFAAVTPPALTILLSTSLNTDAIANSTGGMGRGDRDKDYGGHKDHSDHNENHGRDDHSRRGWWTE
jgi:hypothetical protein